MSSLISLRAELMRGDFRALYLGWLSSLHLNGRDDEDGWDGEDPDGDDRLEPPVPPGLAKLSAPLRALAEFLRVDDELIGVAAAGGAGEPPAEPSRSELARWIKGLPAAEKDAYLARFLAEEGDLLLRAELSKRSREATVPGAGRLGNCSPLAMRRSRGSSVRRPRARPRSGPAASASRPRPASNTSTIWPAASPPPGARSKS